MPLKQSAVLLLVIVSTSLFAAEPAKSPATKPAGGWGVRQVLADDPKLPHVLLIGDSILNGYNGSAAALLKGKVNLDIWVTPKHVGSGDLPKDMKEIFSGHDYDVILFNDIGLHAWQAGRIPEGKYEPLLRAHIANLRKFAPKAKLIFATTTPMTTKTMPITIDNEFNPVIEQRNQIAIKVMAENQIPVVDFYAALAGKTELAAGDRFHWKKPAYQIIAQLAAMQIAKTLGLELPATDSAPAK